MRLGGEITTDAENVLASTGFATLYRPANIQVRARVVGTPLETDAASPTVIFSAGERKMAQGSINANRASSSDNEFMGTALSEDDIIFDGFIGQDNLGAMELRFDGVAGRLAWDIRSY